MTVPAEVANSKSDFEAFCDFVKLIFVLFFLIVPLCVIHYVKQKQTGITGFIPCYWMNLPDSLSAATSAIKRGFVSFQCRTAAASSRETWRPGCVSASPRLESPLTCDPYRLVYETACRFHPPFRPQSCACRAVPCRAAARVSKRRTATGRTRDEGSFFGSGPGGQSFCPSMQLSRFRSAMHVIIFPG